MSEIKPKVFISYAWTSEEYVARVVELANKLQSNGVEVLLDQFEMKPGNSLNHFMEQCVNNSTVTHVLMLLNPEYKEKANNRKGGAGIETQIISYEVYNNLNNQKFIPILFDKGGLSISDCIPTYLKDRYRLDLSNEDTFSENYIQLLRTLFNKPVYKKAELGNPPKWLLEDKISERESIIEQEIKNAKRHYRIHDAIDVAFDLIAKEINEYCESEKINSLNVANFLNEYQRTFKIRNLILKAIFELKRENIEENVFDMLEFLDNKINRLNLNNFDTNKAAILKFFLHEIFIEIIALMFKNNNYSTLYSLITRTYLVGPYKEAESCSRMFYSLSHANLYNFEENLRYKLHPNQDKHYFTGVGQIWITNLPNEFLSRDDFANADILISNICASTDNDHWFALTYVYQNNGNSWVVDIASGLKSKKLCERYAPLFGVTTVDEVRSQVENIRKFDIENNYRFGYQEAFDTIDMISKHINLEEIGKLN